MFRPVRFCRMSAVFCSLWGHRQGNKRTLSWVCFAHIPPRSQCQPLSSLPNPSPWAPVNWRTVKSPLTCGGGSPPAPGGHTGNIFLIFSLLHSQEGEGFSMLQFPFRRMSLTASGTEAVVHSFCPTMQGVSLSHDRAKAKMPYKTGFLESFRQ